MNRESEKNPRKMEESLNLEKGELYGKSKIKPNGNSTASDNNNNKVLTLHCYFYLVVKKLPNMLKKCTG